MLNNDITDLEQSFTYEIDIFGFRVQQELEENGIFVAVNEINKETYVEKLCLTKTLKEVETQIESFKKGFYEIVPKDLVSLFSPGELEMLISGKPDIDMIDLLDNLQYEGLRDNPVLVLWFKEIVEVMDQNMLANLLFFITGKLLLTTKWLEFLLGSLKVPYGGFKSYPIKLSRGSSNTSSLPIAHTWYFFYSNSFCKVFSFREMEVPKYKSKEEFYEKLILAIVEGKEGFLIA